MKTNDAFVLRKIYGKNVLMPIRRNDVGDMPIVLNDVASVIWENVGCCKNNEELVELISSLYNLENESSERYAVEVFIDKLMSMGLIEGVKVNG